MRTVPSPGPAACPRPSTGEHTLTLQGSVSRGVVLTIPAKVTTAAEGCPVDDATLTWGFKETFRSYISGSIANGEWTVADGATYETPDFGWSDGTGAYDPDGGEGLIAFTRVDPVHRARRHPRHHRREPAAAVPRRRTAR